MKLVLISDTHGYQPKVPDGDIMIHAGDTCAYTGSKADFLTFVKWMGQKKPKHKVLVVGNHDKWAAKQPSGYIRSICAEHGIFYLDNSSVVIEGIKIWGSPMSPEVGEWAFGIKKGLGADMWRYIPFDTDIIVTHGPAYGVNDLLARPRFGEDPHNGDIDLYNRIMEIKPLLHVCGHIHEGYGHTHIDGVDFINAAHLDERGQQKNKAVIWEIN
jgi:Icc-related predicted phosphoesterase